MSADELSWWRLPDGTVVESSTTWVTAELGHPAAVERDGTWWVRAAASDPPPESVPVTQDAYLAFVGDQAEQWTNLVAEQDRAVAAQRETREQILADLRPKLTAEQLDALGLA